MPIALLCAVFMVSGASALVFETLWFLQAGLGFGNGVWASSLVLSGFMGGVALGGWLAARFADRAPNALRAYAGLEVTVAVSGVALSYLLPQVHRGLAPFALPLASYPGVLDALRLLLAFALLLVPSTAMGMSLPLLLRAGAKRDANFGRLLGLLYGVNTLGAVVGAVATETVLLPQLGVRGSTWFAAALNLGVASVAFILSRRLATAADTRVPTEAAALDLHGSGAGLATEADTLAPTSAAPPVLRGSATWLAAAFVSGFILLALEVVWLRVLLLFINDTPLAFAMILALVLTGIALGSLLASAWAARAPYPESAAPLLAYVAGLSGLGGYLLYPVILQRFIAAQQPAAAVLMVASPLIVPTCLASGALFTLLGAGLRRTETSHARTAGLLGLFNTLGAGLGSLVAGFVLLPRLGMEWSLFGLLALYGLVGVTIAGATQQRKLVRAVSIAVFAGCLALFPFGFVRAKYIRSSARRWMLSGDAVRVREGLTATILHVVHRVHGAPLFDQVMTNAYSMTVNGFFGRRYMKLFVYLPAALHPQLRRTLVVGYGIGNTTEALTEDPGVERVDVVDISRDLLEISRGMKTRGHKRALDDPRVHVHIEDGRFFLESTDQRYDLITAEPPPPIIAGVVSLYTREHFELMYTRLADGGMATYWLPMMNISAATAKSIIAGFCAAFPDCSLWRGVANNFVLLGTRHAKGPLGEAEFSRAWQDPVRSRELQSIGLELPSQLGALFVGDAVYLRELSGNAAPLEDDWPKRIQQSGTPEERDALVVEWRDTSAARERFLASAFVRRLWPGTWRDASAQQFENERLLDDLLYAEPTWARGTSVLHQVLRNTRLQLPVLLLMKSDPDIQQAIARLTPAEREQEQWLPHRAAGRLAVRDWHGALELLMRTPKELLPIPDVTDYVAYAIERMAQRPVH
jgi:predicted membrane-bound spermidine synthase